MATNSDFEALLRYDAADMDDGDPTDTDKVRTLLNNALHFADQHYQVRVKWIAPGDGTPISPAVLGRDSTQDNNKFVLVFSTRFLCNLRPDNSAPVFRVRLRGAGASGAGTWTFRVVIRENEREAASVARTTASYTAGSAGVAEFSTTSTTQAWLTGGTGTTFTVPDAVVSQATKTMFALTEQGGDNDAVVVTELVCQVWGASTDGQRSPDLSGLVVEEYVGT